MQDNTYQRELVIKDDELLSEMQQTYNQFNQPIAAAVSHWKGAKLPQKTMLIGRTVYIAPLDIAKHAKPLYESLAKDNQGDTWTYLPYGPFASTNDFSDWLQATEKTGEVKFYVLIARDSDMPQGIAAYQCIVPEHGSIEIGHLHYAKDLQKTVASTEAMFLMMQYVFDELGYRRYEWKCNHLNETSWQAAVRLGFTFEGIFRQHFVFKGHNRDTAWFSILDSEWPAIKAKLIAWLSPLNFDAAGCQKLRLKEIHTCSPV